MTKKLSKVYFAHPVNTYNTILEQYVLEWFKRMPKHNLINPNEQVHQEGYKNGGMEYFKNIVESCDYVFVLPFADNSIGAGIAKEIQWALDKNIECLKIKLFERTEIFSLLDLKVLTVEETREKLKPTL